jgi:SSS family solute:Na+ symporter
VPNFTAIDWLILLVYCAFVLGIGYVLKPYMETGKDFFQAGRALPASICALAFVAVSLGAPEVLAMGAAGAQFGLQSGCFFAIGAIPAMLFSGLFMVPLYYGSKARTVPEFLMLRFDQKTRILNACTFLVMTVFSAGICLYAIARILQALHLFDRLFLAFAWPLHGVFLFSIVLLALIVLVYVLLGGLAGAMYNQILQFFLLMAGLLPLVLIGLHAVGGWSGLKASIPAAGTTGGSPLHGCVLGIGLGFVFAAGYWCTDFRVLQTAMAARDIESAQRAPMLAALLRLFLPLLLILPGLLAIGLPTPHTTTTISTTADGAIVHEITVVPPQVAQGRGAVPAQVDPRTNQPMFDVAGQTMLDYDMATPNLLLHFLPTGLLGLALTALLACFMSGMAGSLTALSAVFTCDLYQAFLHKSGRGRHSIAVGRWAALAGVILSIGAACAVSGSNSILDSLLLVFSLANAPLLATLLLGMFWRRATGHGAFAGLAAGTIAALLHHALTLPIGSMPGMHGGWIAVLHLYPSVPAQAFWTAVLAFTANLIVTVPVSYCSTVKPVEELVGLVHSLTPRPAPANVPWWNQPLTLAAVVLLMAVALTLFVY